MRIFTQAKRQNSGSRRKILKFWNYHKKNPNLNTTDNLFVGLKNKFTKIKEIPFLALEYRFITEDE